MKTIEEINQHNVKKILSEKKIPDFFPGDVVKVGVRITEGKKERIQYFEGVCIAKKNITLNCVSPGFIQSRMTDNIVESVKAVLTSRIPMSRLGKGEDVANSVIFLSSDQASYITGETLHVNGGMYMA